MRRWVALFFLLSGCLGGGPALLPPSERPSLPDLSFTPLDGGEGRLSDFRGRIVLVDLVALGCTSCVAESKAIQGAFERINSSHLVLLLLDPAVLDDPTWLRSYVEKYGVPGVQAGFAPPSFVEGVGIDSLDWNALLDSKGRVAWSDRGPTSESTFREVILRLLSEEEGNQR